MNLHEGKKEHTIIFYQSGTGHEIQDINEYFSHVVGGVAESFYNRGTQHVISSFVLPLWSIRSSF
jgi:hypothetical protein